MRYEVLVGVLGQLVAAPGTVSTVTGGAVESGGTLLTTSADQYAADDREVVRRLRETLPESVRLPL